jgi:hypothetical protein
LGDGGATGADPGFGSGRPATATVLCLESLTGLDLADPEAVMQIGAALTVLDVAGPRLDDGDQ